MEKVLVLMATYNGEKYLQEQLDSIYRQKNVMVDVLVRDDGSSDLTQEILEMNSKTKNLTWYSGEHKNVQKGFFELMRKAAMLDYEYYAFCDQDDVWFDDKLSIAISRIPKTNCPLCDGAVETGISGMSLYSILAIAVVSFASSPSPEPKTIAISGSKSVTLLIYSSCLFCIFSPRLL